MSGNRQPVVDRQPAAFSTWRSYGGFYRHAWSKLAVATSVSILQALVLLPVPLLFMLAFDQLRPGGTGRRVVLAGLAVLGLQLLSAGLAALSRHLSLGVTKRAIMRVRERLLEKLYLLPRSRYATSSSGALHDLIVHDTERVDVMSNALVATALPAVCLGLGIGAILCALNWKLFLVTLAVFPLIFCANYFLKSVLRRGTSAFHRAFERFSRGTLFALEAMDLTRIQGAEDAERRRQSETLDELRRRSRSIAWQSAAYWNLQGALFGVTSVVVLVLGGLAVTKAIMSLGELMSFFAGLALLRGPLGGALQALPQVIEGGQSLQRVVAFLGSPEPPAYDGTERVAFRGCVELDEVTFGYGNQPILRRASFELQPGSKVGLVGPSGAGKSTLMMLVLGFYRPHTGQIRADGIPLERLDIAHLRRQVGALPQDPIVFPGTIWENLTYGTEDIDRDEVLAAVRAAMVDEFVEQLPQRFDTPIGDRGTLLSGGQRQRIALARALVRRPSLVILDEPTNHLDSAMVQQIIERIRAHCPRSTILVIGHDARLLGDLDLVLTLRDGRLEVPAAPVGGPASAATSLA